MRTRFRRTTTVVAAGMLTAMLATATTASASTTQVTQTVTSGSLQGFIVGSNLTPVAYNHSSRYSDGSMDLRVNDSTGSDAGWHVTVQSSDFVHGGAGPAIPAANFNLSYISSPELSYNYDPYDYDHSPGQAVGTGGPHAGAGYASLDQARIVASADPGYGKGRYELDLYIGLSVPGQTLAGSYTATVTTTAISGPHNEPV